jgi:adenylylsulfate kinase-like enzyme
VIRYPADKKQIAKADYDRLSMQGTHCIYVDDATLKDGLCKGLAVNDTEYARIIDDLCDIVTKSGVSVVLCTENEYSSK